MATPSDSSAQDPAPGSEIPKQVDGNGQVAKSEAASDTSEKLFLAPSEPVREDQVQNAVKFLSHPKVRGSPVMYRRSFLEKKGLTKVEIDEAFRRVPDPPSNATSVEAVTSNQVSQPKPFTSLQQQAPTQSQQPAGVPVSSVSMVPTVHQSRLHWSHALIAAGVLAASGAGTAVFFKNVVVPRLKTWIRKVVAEDKEPEKEGEPGSALAEQTAEAAKAAATAAAVVAKASEELLNSKNEERKYFEAFMSAMDVQVKEMKSMGEAIRKLESTRETNPINEERKYFEAFRNMMDGQVKEMKSMGEAIRKLEHTSETGRSQDKIMEEYIRSSIGNGTTNNSWRTPQFNQSNTGLSSGSGQMKMNGTANPEYGEGRPSSAPATVEATNAPHPKSYMPWEVPQQKPSYSRALNSGNGQNDISSNPSWKNKAAKVAEVESEAQEARQKHGWVPPQPPAVAIPESAVAIRQPKSYVQQQQQQQQQQQSGDIARSDDGENGVEDIPHERTEPETSTSVFDEPARIEIEEHESDKKFFEREII